MGSKPSSDNFTQEYRTRVRYPAPLGNLVSGGEHRRSDQQADLRDRASGAGDPKLTFDQAAPIAGFGLARASAGLRALGLRSKREVFGSHPNVCYAFVV